MQESNGSKKSAFHTSKKRSVFSLFGKLFIEIVRVIIFVNVVTGNTILGICENNGKYHRDESEDGKYSDRKKTEINPTTTTIAGNKSDILLMTARSKVSDIDSSCYSQARILFNTGSQSYITGELRQKLSLRVIRREKIILNTFGDETSEVCEVDVVRLRFHCFNGRNKSIEAICIPIICAPLQNQRTVEISRSVKEFDKLFLADFSNGDNNDSKGVDFSNGDNNDSKGVDFPNGDNNDSKEVDFSNGDNNDSKGVGVLIGIDFYYSFVTGEIKYGNIGETYAIGIPLWLDPRSSCRCVPFKSIE